MKKIAENRYAYTTNKESWRLDDEMKAAGYTKTNDCYWAQIYTNAEGAEVYAVRMDEDEYNSAEEYAQEAVEATTNEAAMENEPTPSAGRVKGERTMHEMKQVIETMKQAGYKVYATKGRDFISTERSRGGWVFAITPSDNVLYVQRGEFGGWEISLQYMPSRKNGSGCRANDMQPYAEITPAILEEAERENLKFAQQLRATLYKSSEDWRRGYWAELIQL